MNQQRGFTLIELAIVMVILTILAGGLLVPLTRRIEVQHIETTRRTLDEARDALIGFAMSHPAADSRPYLPCPDTNDDGLENRTGSTCTGTTGNLPWVTLGLASVDAWGNRITYSVTAAFANSSNGINPGGGMAGDNRVCSTADCTAGIDIADAIPVVLLSHGANGLGAVSASGTALTAPASADEIENDDGATDFVSHPPGGEGTAEFDDIVIWIPSSVLIARVCPAGCP
jgi:prepilin-type N-terminal cleavage/methylation domain-containing protein